MKILAFGASNSRNSINKQLASHAANVLKSNFITNAEIEILDLNDFEMPIYSSDIENDTGIPAAAQSFLDKIASADALIISYAEHNGGYTVAFKNVFDWASRINGKVYQGRPTVALSTSPGPGAASSVMASALGSASFFGGNITANLSVGSFYDVFDAEKGELTDPELASKLQDALGSLTAQLSVAA